MDTLTKLQTAIQHMKEAERLVLEASDENRSLQIFYSSSIDAISHGLNEFSDNSMGHQMKYTTSLEKIIASEGHSWKNEQSPQVPTLTPDPNREFYFYPALREWISNTLLTDMTSSDQELMKAFTEKGIHKKLARFIVEGERQHCLEQGKNYKIDFDSYEPEDDRIFSASDMFDLAFDVGQEAMSAGFLCKKSINDLSLDDYISAQIERHEGDGSQERWIPRNKWPKVMTELSNDQDLRKKKLSKKRDSKGNRPGK